MYCYLLCHGLPERSPFIFDWQFPLCWRCSGILLATIIGVLLMWSQYGKNFTHFPNIWWPLCCCGFIIPIAFDVFTVKMAIRESNNYWRFFSGFFFGGTIAILSYPLLANIGSFCKGEKNA